MPHYAVSFEIKSGPGYGDRYSSLIAQIRAVPGKNVWEETTSFALVETTESLEIFADRLYYKSDLNSVIDKLLVMDHFTGKAIVRGPILYPHTLGGHFYSCVKK